MPDTPADVNPTSSESEAALTSAEGRSMVPVHVRVHIVSLRQTSNFSPSRLRVLLPRATHVLFVIYATRALDGHKT